MSDTFRAQVEALEQLAALDSELSELGAELSRERESLDGKKSHLNGLEEKLRQNQTSVTEMERMRGELVQETRQMSLQIDKSREKLSRCRTEREANAVQRELEELRKLYRDRELEIEKLNGLTDQARTESEKLETERAALVSELGASEGEVTDRLSNVEEQATGKETQRKELVGRVPPALYRRYEMIRKRRGTAIAFTTEGTCSECHMLLPPMQFQKLMREESFDQCPSCHRILYFRAAVAATEEAQGAADSPPSGAG